MNDIDPIILDRRVLIQHILEDGLKRGIEIVLPVGCSSFDEWLLDSLDVNKLLSAITSQNTIDLTSICENTRPRIRRLSVASDISEALGTQLELEKDVGLPRLGISFLSSQMDDQGLRDVAYEIFVDCCGKAASPALLQSIRGQLEISEKRAQSLHSLLGKVGGTSRADISSHIKMLEVAVPSDFQNFRSYMTWRDGVSMLIQLSLIHSVETSWRSGDADETVNAHYLLAVMKGGFRRLDSRDADDYDAREKADAMKAVAAVCEEIASNCVNGYHIPWDIKASIAEVLLRGSFDSFDDSSLIDEADELECLLKKNVWPVLGISDEIHLALQVWAHYRQFYISKEISLLERAIDMISHVGASPKADVSPKRKLVQEIVQAISAECIRVLSDYHQLCNNPREVSAMIRLFVGVNRISGESESLDESIKNAVKSSVTASFERKAGEMNQHSASEQDQISVLATTCLELLRAECEEYAPMFHHYIPNSTGIASAALHEAYGAKLLPWIVSIRSLDKHIIATLSTAMSLEDQLLLEMMQFGMEPPEWGVLERVTPQLYEWTGGQLKTLKEWGERILASETWKVPSHSSHGCGNSVGEILKASTDVLEALFTMGIPIPPGVVRCLVDGVDGVLQEYCDGIVQPLKSVDEIFPPKPALTRYKKDLVDTAQHIDSPAKPGSLGEKSPSSLKNITAKVGSVFTSSWLPNLNARQKEMILEIPYDSLAMQANSLSKVADGMNKMGDVVIQKWESGQPRSSRARGDTKSLAWTSGMFDDVITKATKDIDVVLHFTALKLVCGHLRDDIFSQLYRFDVQGHRIHPILTKIDDCLGRMCSILYPSLTSGLVEQFCKALSDAVAHVLLDGGPVRWFSISDGTLLKEDMEAMGYMFYADGDGLDQDTIENLMAPCLHVVQLMDEDTATLISLLKKKSRTPEGDIILRVLCHRKDHSASKYLKKEFKIQKKLPNIVQSSISKKG